MYKDNFYNTSPQAGAYTVKIGSSSANIQQTASVSLPKEKIVEKCNKILAPQVPVNELMK